MTIRERIKSLNWLVKKIHEDAFEEAANNTETLLERFRKFKLTASTIKSDEEEVLKKEEDLEVIVN